MGVPGVLECEWVYVYEKSDCFLAMFECIYDEIYMVGAKHGAAAVKSFTPHHTLKAPARIQSNCGFKPQYIKVQGVYVYMIYIL